MKMMTRKGFSAVCLLGLSFFVACETESFPITGDTETQEDTSNTTTIDYFPRAVGNQWTYTEVNSEMTRSMNITGTATYEGETYFMFDDLTSIPTDGSTGIATLSVGIRKDNSDYILFSPEITASLVGGVSATVTSHSFTFLRDDALIGETWTENTSVTISFSGGGAPIPDEVFDLVYKMTLVNRDFSFAVNGENYPEVIRMRIDLAAIGDGNTQNFSTDVYFANNVGPIYSGEDTVEFELISFSLN